MTAAAAGTPALLDLEEIGHDLFVAAVVPTAMPHVFGGQVMAQGLVAAGRTVTGHRPANSLHAFFLRAGDVDAPIEYAVQRVRDGRRFATRSVTAAQHGRPIATLSISFAETEDTSTAARGNHLRHQIRPPAMSRPENVPTLAEAAQQWGGLGPVWGGFDALEIRVDPAGPIPSTRRG